MTLFKANGKWRGIMPFRRAEPVKGLLDSRRRTGEPSLATILSTISELQDKGNGKASGSFTEKMRESLWQWLEQKQGTWVGPITFEYKLSRKQVIVVTGRYPWLRHNPSHGRGSRGFMLHLRVDSIDGLPLQKESQDFAWNRIIGREKMLLLPEGNL